MVKNESCTGGLSLNSWWHVCASWYVERATLLLLAAVLGATMLHSAWAIPQECEVVGGEGAIYRNHTTTVIQQQSSLMAIEWRSFNVAVGEKVQFVQPSVTSMVLIHILDRKPSEILGAIEANGRVFISNRSGIIFSEATIINTGGFIATRGDVAIDDFMEGLYVESLGVVSTGAISR